MKEITTENLRLHTWNSKLLQQAIHDPQQLSIDLGLYIGEGFPNEDERKDLFPFLLESLQKGNDAHWYGGLVIHQEDAAIIGCAGFLSPPDVNGSIEIGYGIVPAYQRRGFATEIARALIKWSFEFSDVKSVTAAPSSSNAPSIRVMEKLGMQKTGFCQGLVNWVLKKE
ncbi:GNAT family N-acetyltransferase [Metabacillus sp. GX 13764]|uniref:GNAT family N-acetyltransferase n=1 Tax=Metabacillus kandeliae TaxID=2900151 RepID=UPI001E32C460|nr:GNAT family N-acetyltransferase [Metabacillus kandeliae]MCD7035349.1 GNAT family N-acetyltransferase [Metabacillus kandeliae]